MASLLSGLGKLFGKFTFNAAEQAVGFGVGAGLGAALAPEVQDLLNLVWPENANVPLTVADLANMVVQGVKQRDDAAAEAAMSGVSGDRFDAMVRVTGEPPGAEQLLSMWDRGIIGEADVRRGLLQSRIKPEWVDAVIATNPALITVPDLAEMVVQGVLDESEAAALAAKFSYSAEQFHNLILLAGSPPGPETVLTMWNRGILSESDVDLAIKQSRLKPQWLDTYKQLRFRPLTAAEAANLVVRGWITAEQGSAIAEQDGESPDNFALRLDGTGRPPGPGQLRQALNRGLINVDRFNHGIVQTDIRPEWEDLELALRYSYPSAYQLKSAVTSGALTAERALVILQYEGYEKQDAQALVSSWVAGTNGKAKDLVKGEILTLYQGRYLTAAQATSDLKALGETDTAVTLLLELADAQRVRKFKETYISKVNQGYVKRYLTREQATAELDSLGLPSQARDDLMGLWDAERGVTALELTPGEINGLVHKGVVTPQVGQQLLVERGADEMTAWLKIAAHTGPIPDSPVSEQLTTPPKL